MSFRLLHSADLHLGRRFGAMPEGARGRLVEARHQILNRLAQAARDAGAAHILVAGDVFDTETPSDAVWRQALAAIAADPGLAWWLIPGNHDSLAAEPLWDQLRRNAPANLHLLDHPEAVTIAPGVSLLPCPLPRRRPGRDLSAWMVGAATPEGHLRIGLAHGPVQGFGDEGGAGIIPPDRAETAGLDYLALGDWHGAMRIGARAWYAGTPECDGFRRAPRGQALVVAVPGGGAAPAVDPVITGAFTWTEAEVPLVPGLSAAKALSAFLPADRAARRDHLMRLRPTGRATLAEQAALAAAVAEAAPEFALFELDTAALATEVEASDLEAIDKGGALRLAAEVLAAGAGGGDPAMARLHSAALNRLYGYLSGGRA
ncbi:MAG: exonuclease SbcCD subunit D [Gemmobacter sp.]